MRKQNQQKTPDPLKLLAWTSHDLMAPNLLTVIIKFLFYLFKSNYQTRKEKK